MIEDVQSKNLHRYVAEDENDNCSKERVIPPVAPDACVDLRAMLCRTVDGQRCVKGTIRGNDSESTNGRNFDNQDKQR